VARADRPARRHRGLRILVIVVLVLIVVLIAADRIGLVIAERTVASKAQTQLVSEGVALDGKPTVHIHGFPFLTQVIAGHYDRIDIAVPNPSGRGVRFDSLTVTATDVTAPTKALIDGNGRIEAAKVIGTGELGWASFSQLVDLSGVKQYGIDPSQIKIGSTDSGHLSISAPVTFQGQTFTVQGNGTITVNKDVLHVEVSKVTASDTPLPQVLQSMLQAIASQLTFDVRIPQLPYRLSLDSVRATSSGISITASASDVVLGG
jgi:hypothetical protein